MGYSYADSAGFIGHGPSIGGSVAMLDELKKIAPEGFPNLRELLDTGESDNPEAVAGEIKRMLPAITDKDVKSTLLKLARVAAIAKGVLTVTH